jgi:hypothetical protein
MIECRGKVIAPAVTRKPYEDDEGFNQRWWSDHPVFPDRLRWFSFIDGADREIVRAEIEPGSSSGDHYLGVKVPPQGFTQIHLFEVRVDQRRRGYGRYAVELLTAAFPDVPMSAYSEGGDEFWTGLGWCPHVHPKQADDPLMRCQLLFISPAAPAAAR